MTDAAAGTAFDRITEALRADGRKVSTRRESEARAKCPAHDGTSDDSLSIQRTEDRALIHCFSGCDRQDVLAALNMADRDLFDQPRTTYGYTTPIGTLARTVTRSYDAGKRTFRQSVHEEGPTTLYRLPELAAAPPSAPIYLVEGEEDVHAVEAAGGIGTTAPQGAGNFHHADVEPLRGRVVVAVVDKDQAGQKWAASVREKVGPVAAVLSFKQARTGKDFSDHLAAGHGLSDLEPHVTPDVEPEARKARRRATVADKKRDTINEGDALTCDVADVADIAQSSERGADVLDDVRAALVRFVAFPSPSYAIATALWVLHTYALDVLDSSPRIAFLSPEPQSGKTRALEIVEQIADRPLFTMNTTCAVLARGLDSGAYRTVMLDEADTVFGSKAKGDEELRGILNSGHRRGATYTRMVGEGTAMAVSTFDCFSAVALAGIGNLPDTVMQRAVVLKMRRRAPGESVEPFRRRRHVPELNELRARVESWVVTHKTSIGERWPEMPEGITDRPADVWEPLLAIADEAGGSWPEDARRACLDLYGAAQTEDTGSLGVRLLSDLRALWGAQEDPAHLPSETILTGLHEMDEAPWATLRGEGLDARGLAYHLKQYDVRSKDVRTPFGSRKGYARADLWDAWERYAPVQTEKGDIRDVRDIAGQRVADAQGVADEKRDAPSDATSPDPATCSTCGTKRQPSGRCVRCEVEGRRATP